MTLASHPYAELFPLIEGPDFDELVDDVRERGLLEKIALWRGEILDGRNRNRACLEIDPSFSPETYPDNFFEFDGADQAAALAFVISRNLRRRQLDESQRAFVAAKLANLREGRRPNTAPNGAVSQSEAADTMNVARRSVQRGAEVLEYGSPELQKAVEQGVISISLAAQLARQPLADQLIAIEEGRLSALKAAKAINAEKRAKKHAERVGRIREMCEPNPAMPFGRKWAVIYADPPWQYEDQPMGFTDRSIENHYETMPLDEICALPVSELASDDAVLFMWITSPQEFLQVKRVNVAGQEVDELLDSDSVLARVLRAWGGSDPKTGELTPFVYKAQMCWDKVLIGPGHWFRTQHEILIVATRGHFPPPPEHARPGSMYSEQRQGHSAKPDYFADMIVKMFPDLPRIELFARPPGRPGWDLWGNQAPERSPAPQQQPEEVS